MFNLDEDNYDLSRENFKLRNDSITFRDSDGIPYWDHGESFVNYYNVDGILADDVRARLSLGSSAKVMIATSETWGGYSEYTQENMYSFSILVDGQCVLERESDSSDMDSMFNYMINWLTESH